VNGNQTVDLWGSRGKINKSKRGQGPSSTQWNTYIYVVNRNQTVKDLENYKSWREKVKRTSNNVKKVDKKMSRLRKRWRT
jgi:hypothetical protein